MGMSSNIRYNQWRKRLMGLLALGLCASQLISVVHATDLDAHDDEVHCSICAVLERTGDAPPPSATAPIRLEASVTAPTAVATPVISITRRIQPPTRAPPR